VKKGQERKKKVFLLLCIRSMRARRKDEGTDHLQRNAGLGIFPYSYDRKCINEK